MSQINQFLLRIAQIQAGITIPGNSTDLVPITVIIAADPYQPTKLDRASLPQFVNEIYKGKSDLPISAGQQYRTTLVKMVLALQDKAAGINLKYSIGFSAQWVDAVYSAFAQHVRLSAPAILITASSNTNPIQITTAIGHGLTTGTAVTIAGVQGNTNANGAWIATVLDYRNFTIAAAGNGAGGQTGTARQTQPLDLTNIVYAVVRGWDLIDYVYGDGAYLALAFDLEVAEMFVTSIAG